MNWNVRIECDAPAEDVHVFLDGVFAGMVSAGITGLSITDRVRCDALDVEFSLSSRHRATALARTLTTILQCGFARADACVTLGVDARETGGDS